MVNLKECEVADRFLRRPDEDSFTALFQVFTPQLVAFFQRRGHGNVLAEDLAQEVMLTVYRKARQIRDHKLFRAWLFQIARHAVCRHPAKRTREVPTVTLADTDQRFAAPSQKSTGGPTFEFRQWMDFLGAQGARHDDAALRRGVGNTTRSPPPKPFRSEPYNGGSSTQRRSWPRTCASGTPSRARPPEG